MKEEIKFSLFDEKRSPHERSLLEAFFWFSLTKKLGKHLTLCIYFLRFFIPNADCWQSYHFQCVCVCAYRKYLLGGVNSSNKKLQHNARLSSTTSQVYNTCWIEWESRDNAYVGVYFEQSIYFIFRLRWTNFFFSSSL